VLETSDRVYCPDCIPGFKRERTDKLVSAARSALAEMRGSKHDPAQSDETKARRVAAFKEAQRDGTGLGVGEPRPP
jgi:hypothetical protein